MCSEFVILWAPAVVLEMRSKLAAICLQVQTCSEFAAVRLQVQICSEFAAVQYSL